LALDYFTTGSWEKITYPPTNYQTIKNVIARYLLTFYPNDWDNLKFTKVRLARFTTCPFTPPKKNVCIRIAFQLFFCGHTSAPNFFFWVKSNCVSYMYYKNYTIFLFLFFPDFLSLVLFVVPRVNLPTYRQNYSLFAPINRMLTTGKTLKKFIFLMMTQSGLIV